MPQSSTRRGFALFAVIVLFFSVSATAQSDQGFSTSYHPEVQGVLARSGDISANVGVNNVGIIEDKAHVQFGAAYGYSFVKQLTLSGEFSYLPLSVGIAHLNVGLYGMNLRYYPLAHPFGTSRVVPYMTLGYGYANYRATGTALNGSYLGLGAGTNLYITPHVGIRPEYRWESLEYNISNTNFYDKSSHFTVAIFYQWGGKE
jgi:Outer membrane protein beta-barrel domain